MAKGSVFLFSFKRYVNFLLQTEGMPKRKLEGGFRSLSIFLGSMISLIVFYTAFNGVFANLIQNSMVLCVLLALCFLWYPATHFSPKDRPSFIDCILVALSLAVMSWTLLHQPRFEMRIPLVSEILLLDKIAGVILILLVLECCRRTAGMVVTAITCVAIWYAFAGPSFDSMFKHPGFDFDKFIDVLYLTTEGVFGSLVGMVASVLFGFISFGVFMASTGGDKYFMNIALSLAGKQPGGPAKVAVIGSGLMGMISGSSVANIVTTGSVTIPLMKSIGYKPEEAGAVEACASSGGQIMPPVMGAGAFLMADYLGITIFDVASVSFLPAVLFYLGLWWFNDKIARKRGLKGMEEVPRVKEAIFNSMHMWIPILVLITMCMMKFSPFYSAVVCTLFVFVFAMFKEKSLRLLKSTFNILEGCAVSMVSIAGILAAAAVIVAIISQTGLMVKSTSIILAFAGGTLFFTVIILLVISYFMGMGLPVTSCYVILASLGVPALVKCGASDIGAHLMLFWSSMVAGITPPVCVAAFVAANVAKADAMKTGFQSLKMGSLFYLVPITFLKSDFLTGGFTTAVIIFAILCVSTYHYVAAIEGYMLQRLNLIERVASWVAFLCSFISVLNIHSLQARLAMLVLSVIIFVVLQITQRKIFKFGQ
ncbi:MAG: TRAP transporter fused permease subunit [bacterium]|nr:TRAP transporter fused permease subunit [bacterium]